MQNRLRYYRERAGIEAAKLAREAHRAESTVHRIENGDGNPRPTTLHSLYKALLTLGYPNGGPSFEEVFPMLEKSFSSQAEV